MDQFPGSPLWLGVVPLLAWQAAVDAGAEAVAFSTDDELVVSWRAAGIVDADGRVEPRWAQALRVARDAVDGMVVAAQHGGLAFLSNVHVAGDEVVVARSRALDQQRVAVGRGGRGCGTVGQEKTSLKTKTRPTSGASCLG